MKDTTNTTLTKLSPRRDLKAADVQRLLAELRTALDGAHALEYFTRMELNHDSRHCWWPGQTGDGRKWPKGRKLMPGQKPNDVFPWPGASDARVPIVEEIIQERVTFKRVGLKRAEKRIGPRNLSPDDDPQQKSVLWGQTADYYADMARDSIRTAAAQVADIAEEYGCGILYVTWETTTETSRRTITGDDILRLAMEAAMQMAQQQAMQEGAEEVTEEQSLQIMAMVESRITELILDPEMKPQLVQVLMGYDPQMQPAEAKRVADALKLGEPVDYYVAEVRDSKPEWRALTPFVDVWFPATTVRLKDAPWIAMSEWLTKVELQERIETEGYSKAWVDKVLERPGRAVSFEDNMVLNNHSWILANGGVRQVVSTAVNGMDRTDSGLFQIVHVFWRAAAIGGAPALFHSVLHDQVNDQAGKHGCCEHAHGKYPFVEHLREQTAAYVLGSRGVGEISFTQQQEVKVQHDLRSDDASIKLKPPMKVPLNHAGGSVDLRPGAQIPVRNTAGMGQMEPLKLGADPRGSQEVEQTTRDMINSYWGRGSLVEPDVKITMRQLLVDDWLADIRQAQLMTFQLVQEFAPDEVKANFVGGLPVNMTVSRDEIQGQASLELDFDVADLDPGQLEQRVKSITALKALDVENIIPLQPLLKALASYLMPSHYRFLIADPAKQAMEETADERRIIGDLLNGLEPAYIPGQNHQVRLDEMQRVFGMEIDKEGNVRQVQPLGQDGQMTKPQRTATTDPDVASLVQNRFKFHAFQLQQQENAGTGRLGVEPVREGAA